MLNLVKLRQNSAIKFLSVTSKALRYLEGVLPIGKINDCDMNSLAIPKVSVLFFSVFFMNPVSVTFFSYHIHIFA